MEIRQTLNGIDKSRVKKQFNSAAETYETFDFLQQEVSNRLFDRLQDILVSPRLIIDLGSGTGRAGELFEKSCKKSEVITVSPVVTALTVAVAPEDSPVITSPTAKSVVDVRT